MPAEPTTSLPSFSEAIGLAPGAPVPLHVHLHAEKLVSQCQKCTNSWCQGCVLEWTSCLGRAFLCCTNMRWMRLAYGCLSRRRCSVRVCAGVQIFDKWTLSQLDAAEYEEAPPAPEWVVQEAAQREGARNRDAYEAREALESELPGFAGIKHHITAEELVRRRRSLALEERTSMGSAPGGEEGMAAISGIARGSIDEDALVDMGGRGAGDRQRTWRS